MTHRFPEPPYRPFSDSYFYMTNITNIIFQSQSEIAISTWWINKKCWFQTSWLPVRQFNYFADFLIFLRASKIFFLHFLERKITVENNKVDSCGKMAKSQFLFNFERCFKKMTKIREPYFANFFNISQSTGQESLKISVVSIFKLFHRLAWNSSFIDGEIEIS